MKKTTNLSWMAALALMVGGAAMAACGGGDDGESDGGVDIPDGGSVEVEDMDLGLLGSGKARVSVTDSITGRIVSGCQVIATQDGQSGAIPLKQSKDHGRYEADGIDDSSPLTVSVFCDSYNYVTVAGLAARDLSVPVRRLTSSRRGGITGGLENWPESGDKSTLAVGIAALALQGNVIDFDQDAFLGDSVQTDFAFPSWLATIAQAVAPGSSSTFPVSVPGSVMLGGKDGYAVLGLPSPCGAPADERAGTCGVQGAFSAYASISGFTDPIVAELYTEDAKAMVEQVVAVIDDGAEFDLEAMLPTALPLLPKILSHVSVGYSRDIQLSFGDEKQSLGEMDLYPSRKFDQTRYVTLPETPKLMDKAHADLLGVIALADLGSQGLVPVGLGAGVSGNGNKVEVSAADGGIALKGATGRIFAIALDSAISHAAKDRTQVPVFSAIMEKAELDAAKPVALGGKFLPAAADTTFSGASRTFGNLPSIEGASLYRAEVKGGVRQWVVYFAPGTGALTLPAVPQGVEDVLTPGKDGHTMLAISLRDGVSMDDLFQDSDVNEDQLNDAMEGFSYAVHYDAEEGK